MGNDLKKGIRKDEEITSPNHLTELCTICNKLIPFNEPGGVGYRCDQDKCNFEEG
jgi:hypothetical protein